MSVLGGCGVCRGAAAGTLLCWGAAFESGGCGVGCWRWVLLLGCCCVEGPLFWDALMLGAVLLGGCSFGMLCCWVLLLGCCGVGGLLLGCFVCGPPPTPYPKRGDPFAEGRKRSSTRGRWAGDPRAAHVDSPRGDDPTGRSRRRCVVKAEPTLPAARRGRSSTPSSLGCASAPPSSALMGGGGYGASRRD